MPDGPDGKARSGLTPHTGGPAVSPDTAGPGTTEQWTEGFQSFWFDGFTTQEVCHQLLAYLPDPVISMLVGSSTDRALVTF